MRSYLQFGSHFSLKNVYSNIIHKSFKNVFLVSDRGEGGEGEGEKH